jgi:hypothetical protein
MLLFCVCVVLYVNRGLATEGSPVQGVLPAVYGLRNWKSNIYKMHTLWWGVPSKFPFASTELLQNRNHYQVLKVINFVAKLLHNAKTSLTDNHLKIIYILENKWICLLFNSTASSRSSSIREHIMIWRPTGIYLVNRLFGGTYLRHLQGVRNPRTMNQTTDTCLRWFIARGFLTPWR